MAYPKDVRQRHYREALGFAQAMGRQVDGDAVRRWLIAEKNPRTDVEVSQLEQVAYRATEAVQLAQRFQDRPEYKPRPGTYPRLPIAYQGEEGYEYRVAAALEGVGYSDVHRGLFVVRSDVPLAGTDVLERVRDQIRELVKGDMYVERLKGKAESPALHLYFVSAANLSVR